MIWQFYEHDIVFLQHFDFMFQSISNLFIADYDLIKQNILSSNKWVDSFYLVITYWIYWISNFTQELKSFPNSK